MFQGGYAELNALAPERFLNWQDFATEWDNMPTTIANAPAGDEYARLQYEKGLEIGRNAERVYIASNGTWGAIRKGYGGIITSYEGIGYHRNTKDLLHGFLESGAPIYVYRDYSTPPVGADCAEYGTFINESALAGQQELAL